MTVRGRFITLEGGEGVGKSTQATALAERLRARGIDVVATREPGGSPHAEEIRHFLLSGAASTLGVTGETLLISAARIDHLDNLIRPALQAGTWVVCDRFIDSTRAYQGALGKLETGLLRAIEKVSVGETLPDLTLMLDLPAEVGMLRAAARRMPGTVVDRFESQPLEFHQGLRNAFLTIAEKEPQRCAVIDAWGEPSEVSQVIWQVVGERLFFEGASRSSGHGAQPSR